MPKLTKDQRDIIQHVPSNDANAGWLKVDWRRYLVTDFADQTERDMRAVGLRLGRQHARHIEAVIMNVLTD
jgi:hypothetical protein